MKFLPQNKIKLRWTPNFAYAIGLITTDGYLSKDKRHIGLKSVDYQLANNLKKALNLTNQIKRRSSKSLSRKDCFEIQFGDINFYRFLNKIGLTSAKSKVIKQVETPDKFFADFLRGVFEGDGSFYTFYDKRWKNSFVYQLSFASASLNFLKWLKHKLSDLYKTHGFFHKGKGIYELRYTKRDTQILFQKIYYSKNSLILNRKYTKIQKYILKDISEVATRPR